jgi:hypothetical protein
MIDLTKLTNDIQAIFDAEKIVTTDQEGSIQRVSSELAKACADAIQRGIETAVVNFTLAAGSSPVTGSITLTVSE